MLRYDSDLGRGFLVLSTRLDDKLKDEDVDDVDNDQDHDDEVDNEAVHLVLQLFTPVPVQDFGLLELLLVVFVSHLVVRQVRFLLVDVENGGGERQG
eukprot:2015358-Rhodomonas_salina.1